MSEKEQQLSAQIAEIQAMARENKNIDAAALIGQALARQQEEFLPRSLKVRAYLVSLFLPPFGLYYVIKLLFRRERDAKRTAWVCLAMTIVTVMVSFAILNSLLSSVPGLDQLQNITPEQVMELTE